MIFLIWRFSKKIKYTFSKFYLITIISEILFWLLLWMMKVIEKTLHSTVIFTLLMTDFNTYLNLIFLLRHYHFSSFSIFWVIIEISKKISPFHALFFYSKKLLLNLYGTNIWSRLFFHHSVRYAYVLMYHKPT